MYPPRGANPSLILLLCYQLSFLSRIRELENLLCCQLSFLSRIRELENLLCYLLSFYPELENLLCYLLSLSRIWELENLLCYQLSFLSRIRELENLLCYLLSFLSRIWELENLFAKKGILRNWRRNGRPFPWNTPDILAACGEQFFFHFWIHKILEFANSGSIENYMTESLPLMLLWLKKDKLAGRNLADS